MGTLVTDRDFTFQAISECYHGVASIGGWNPWVVNNTHYNVNYGNVGTEPLNGSVVATLHLPTTFVSSIPTPDMVDGQMLTWEVIGMAAGANVSINIAYHTDSTALTTDTVSATVVLKNDHLDQDAAEQRRCDLDPSHHLLRPEREDEIALGNELEYTIHFQNTGPQHAVNIVQRVMIATDLNLSSFVIVGAKHPTNVPFIRNEAVWMSAQIVLPDSGSDLLEPRRRTLQDQTQGQCDRRHVLREPSGDLLRPQRAGGHQYRCGRSNDHRRGVGARRL